MRNLRVERKVTHKKEGPWVNVEKERAFKILAGKWWHLSFISC